MKKEVSPAVMIGIASVVIILLGFFAYKAMQPASYTPSPGSPGAPGKAPGMTSSSGQSAATASPTSPDGRPYYPAAPAGSIPGKPPGNGQ